MAMCHILIFILLHLLGEDYPWLSFWPFGLSPL